MQKAWREWEGTALNGEIRLGQYLGGSDHSGVFLTAYGPESRKAAVKVIAVSGSEADTDRELARLQAAAEISHSHLVQILEVGRTELEGQPALFVVMERVDEDLSQILPSRALSAAEVRDMLEPALEALAYLHGLNLVHGRLKPENVMAVGDQLKLSSDGIAPIAGQGVTNPPGTEKRRDIREYDAPELAHGQISPASDVWSLGVLLVVMLTQRLPRWDSGKDEMVLPDRLPGPFEEIARRCLRPEPRDRCTLENIAVRAGLLKAVVPAAAKAPPIVASSVETAKHTDAAAAANTEIAKAELRPHVAPELPKRGPIPVAAAATEATRPAKRRSNTGAYAVAAMVLAVLAVVGIARLFRAPSNTQTKVGGATVPERAESKAPRPARSQSANASTGRRGETADVQPMASVSNAPARPPGSFAGARNDDAAGHDARTGRRADVA